MEKTLEVGREVIARLAKSEGEHVFAGQVTAGCWDHRNDVKKACAMADDGKSVEQIVADPCWRARAA